ncbi:MAG TPA: PQQ-binding-like beta-propeller repeat protein [Candidatus Limnocylindrales bacterium]|jgi:outer membrane protein assembly factor BamB|nr:PQQ-binding-like beta-propeller repeat protein [Candidatus Limnocylindrales bacterium]
MRRDFGTGRLLAWCAGIVLSIAPAPAADRPQWGEAWSRNMVSPERNLPETFDPATGKNIKWSAQLGTETHSSPVIAGGRVYIGTNNGNPRDPKHQGDRGVLMCFEEKTGLFLWQLVVPKRAEDIYFDWPQSGISSPVTVEGDRIYLVSNRGEVMCLDAKGMADGNDGPFQDEGAHMTVKPPDPAATNMSSALTPGPLDADIIWLFDLPTGAGIWPHDAAHSSIVIDGDYLYLNSGTGVDNTHKKIRTPDAPSLVVLNKQTGRLVARDYERMAPNIFHSTWCAPSLAEVKGRPLVFFGGGNGIVYAFETVERASERSPGEPFGLHKVWQFDFDPTAPKTNVHRYNSNRSESPSNFYGMPVFYHNRVYVAGGGDIWWGKNEAWLKCIDATRSGDITTNGLVWSYPLQKHVLPTPAIADGLVFIADCGRLLHCVDAETGKPCWTQEIAGEPWASALVADGKVYLGTRGGNFYVMAATREKKMLASLDLKSPISATSSAANAVLYVATMNRLYAIRSK